jgi:heptaprenylglyceryl phosphate synthase
MQANIFFNQNNISHSYRIDSLLIKAIANKDNIEWIVVFHHQLIKQFNNYLIMYPVQLIFGACYPVSFIFQRFIAKIMCVSKFKSNHSKI